MLESCFKDSCVHSCSAFITVKHCKTPVKWQVRVEPVEVFMCLTTSQLSSVFLCAISSTMHVLGLTAYSCLPTGLALWLCISICYASRKSKNLNIEESHPEETVKKSEKYTLSFRTLGTNICKRRMNSSSLADKSYCLGTVSLTARAVLRQSINQILIISSLFSEEHSW